MPELVSLHPLDDAAVTRYVAVVLGTESPTLLVPGHPEWSARTAALAQAGYARAQAGDDDGVHAISLGLARVLATSHPTFLSSGIGLTMLEARIDRGFGMLLRPPSRLFSEAGLDRATARAMPVRLDPSRGLMGGSFVPARLVPQLAALIETRTQRIARRLEDAGLEPVATLGMLIQAATYATERGLGLFEALDAVTPEAAADHPPGTSLVMPDRKRLDRELRARLEEATKPPKKSGVLARLMGKKQQPEPPPGWPPEWPIN